MDMDIPVDIDGWQPARIAPISNKHKYHPFASTNRTIWDDSQGQVVKVRPIDKDYCEYSVKQYRSIGCNSDYFYEIHPADWERLYGQPPWGVKIMCEHAIQVD